MKNNRDTKSYQLVIIGAGSGGLVAAEFAAKMGAKVALIEARLHLGGECLWNGCVPSKALIHSARRFWQSAHSSDLGVHATPKLDFRTVSKHINDSIHFIEQHHDNDAYFEALGVDVIHGQAEFMGPTLVKVGNDVLRTRKAIIATGSSPAVPGIQGLVDVPYLTNETVFSLKELPKELVVIGGGPIGCELGQAFAMLGSKVTILQSGLRLLPRDEPEVSKALLEEFKSMGIQVILNADISKVSRDSKQISVFGRNVVAKADKLLIATGRQSNIPLGLTGVNVKVNAGGIMVDKHMRTSIKNIYAIGDCNGGVQFTHTAAQQAVVAVQNVLLGIPKIFDQSSVPWVTFTTPEIAHFGPIKQDLNSQKQQYQPARLDFSDIDKAVTEKEAGYIEILTNAKGKILSATVLGANASEILGQIVLMRDLKVPLKDAASVMQAYPTFGLGLKQLSANVTMEKMSGGLTGYLIKTIIRVRAG
jgi:pyruvate/2-oxoglutarate dehydrogenase complex dihydrolipoamide dehydrogenase (E3) component